MKNTGDGRRVARMEKEVQQAVASYLISGFQPSISGLITVTSVRMPADLRAARVYVSILLPHQSEERRDEQKHVATLLEELQACAPDFQAYLASHLKTRYCPKLTFFQDDSTEHVLKVERILHDLELEKRARENGNKSSQDSE
jgi:ribosome-binding factor A